jgi:UDP-glucuronate decarboxylase
VSNFVVQALMGEPITIFGEGRQTRSFCYVDDLVEGLIRLMESDETVTGPVNLGNPDEFTIRELAEKVVEKTGTWSSLAFRPLPADDPQQRRPDIGLARRLLRWEPAIRLDEGLDRTIAYFRGLLPDLRATA